MPIPSVPIAAEREMARREAAENERIRLQDEKLAEMRRKQEELDAFKQRKLAEKPKWGTKEAKRLEIERVRKEIEDRNK